MYEILKRLGKIILEFGEKFTTLVDMIFPYISRMISGSMAQWSSGVTFCLWQVFLVLCKCAQRRLGLLYFLYRLMRAGNKTVFCIDHIYYRFFAPSRIQPAVYHIHFVFKVFLRRLVCGVFLQ